jgi:hypothetical protein
MRQGDERSPSNVGGFVRQEAGEEAERERPLQERHLWNGMGLFSDDTPVAVRYPAARGDGDVWFAGRIVGRFGLNEWEVALDDSRLASGQARTARLVCCGVERLKILTYRELSDLSDDAYRSLRSTAWLNRLFPTSGHSC